MRQAILEGINLSRPPPPPPPLPPPAFLPPAMVPPFYPMHPLYPPRPMGSMPPPPHHHHQHRPRAFPGLTFFLFSTFTTLSFLPFGCHLVIFCNSSRNPVYTSPGWQAGNSWHGCWSVGWEQACPWQRGVQYAGGVSRRERVSPFCVIK